MPAHISLPNPLEKYISPREPEYSEPNFLAEELDFWKGNPPKELIIATGSVRKALMAIYLMKGLVFPLDEETALGEKYTHFTKTPLTLHSYLDKHIFNGDGQLRVKAFLCHFKGVPVYAEPSDGETAHNEPLEQARNKAQSLAEKYKGQNVWILSTDTTDYPDKNGNGERKKDSYLGKIMNHPEFPGFESPELSDFLQKYLDDHYPVGTHLVHSNGLALTNADTGETEHLLVTLHTQIKDRLTTDIVKVFLDVGGGGIFQQVVNWKAEKLLEETADEHAQKALVGKDREETEWILSAQAAGMVWWGFEQLINGQIQGKEVVVFDNQTQ